MPRYDPLTPAERSERMSRIRNADTKPEMMVRRLVHSMGHRYRLHAADLPGNPKNPQAETVEEQGQALYSRLREHSKNIGKVNLDLTDFYFRAVAEWANVQREAEQRTPSCDLISIFAV